MESDSRRDDAAPRPSAHESTHESTQAGAHPPRSIRGGDADLVAYALAGIGYLPWDSVMHVALLDLGGGRLGSGTVARTDVAAVLDARVGGLMVANLRTSLVRAGAAQVAVVVTGRPPQRAQSFRTARTRARVRAAACALPRPFARVEQAILVEGDRYGHVRCPATCCPPDGRPLMEVRASRVATVEAFEGRGPVASREDLGVTPSRDAARRAAVRAAAHGAGIIDHDDRVAACATWDAALTQLAASPVVDPAGLDPADLGVLAAALADRRARDAMLGAVFTAPHASCEGRGTLGSAVLLDPEELSDRLATSGRPPRDRARLADVVLGAVAAHAPLPLRVHALASLGYLRWWTGQGVQADVVTCQALADDPEHTLAGLVRQVLIAHVPPPWFAGVASVGARQAG